MSNPIPAHARTVVRERDAGHCLRCGAAGVHEVHHRRRRGVGEDPHAVCNLVSLCSSLTGAGGCHQWVHKHPEEARAQGFIVSMHDESPVDVPVRSFMGPVMLACDGGITWV